MLSRGALAQITEAAELTRAELTRLAEDAISGATCQRRTGSGTFAKEGGCKGGSEASEKTPEETSRPPMVSNVGRDAVQPVHREFPDMASAIEAVRRETAGLKHEQGYLATTERDGSVVIRAGILGERYKLPGNDIRDAVEAINDFGHGKSTLIHNHPDDPDTLAGLSPGDMAMTLMTPGIVGVVAVDIWGTHTMTVDKSDNFAYAGAGQYALSAAMRVKGAMEWEHGQLALKYPDFMRRARGEMMAHVLPRLKKNLREQANPKPDQSRFQDPFDAEIAAEILKRVKFTTTVKRTQKLRESAPATAPRPTSLDDKEWNDFVDMAYFGRVLPKRSIREASLTEDAVSGATCQKRTGSGTFAKGGGCKGGGADNAVTTDIDAKARAELDEVAPNPQVWDRKSTATKIKFSSYKAAKQACIDNCKDLKRERGFVIGQDGTVHRVVEGSEVNLRIADFERESANEYGTGWTLLHNHPDPSTRKGGWSGLSPPDMQALLRLPRMRSVIAVEGDGTYSEVRGRGTSVPTREAIAAYVLVRTEAITWYAQQTDGNHRHMGYETAKKTRDGLIQLSRSRTQDKRVKSAAQDALATIVSIEVAPDLGRREVDNGHIEDTPLSKIKEYRLFAITEDAVSGATYQLRFPKSHSQGGHYAPMTSGYAGDLEPGRPPTDDEAPLPDDIKKGSPEHALQEWVRGEVDGKEIPDDTHRRVGYEIAKRLDAHGGLVHRMLIAWTSTSNDNDMRLLNIQRDAADLFKTKLSDWQRGRIDKVRAEYKDERNRIVKLDIDRKQFSLGRELTREERRESVRKSLKWIRDETAAGEKTQRLFGSPGKWGTTDRGREEWQDIRGTGKKVVLNEDRTKAVLKDMYDRTQAKFKELGIKEVTVYRGWKAPTDDMLRTQQLTREAGNSVALDSNATESWSFDGREALKFASDRFGSNRDELGMVVALRIPVERVLCTPQTGFGSRRESEVVLLGPSTGSRDVGRVMTSASASKDERGHTTRDVQWLRKNSP